MVFAGNSLRPGPTPQRSNLLSPPTKPGLYLNEITMGDQNLRNAPLGRLAGEIRRVKIGLANPPVDDSGNLIGQSKHDPDP